MRLLGVEKRDIYAAMEFGLAEMQNIARFLKIAIPLYDKIHGDSEQAFIAEIIESERQLDIVIKEIDKNGS